MLRLLAPLREPLGRLALWLMPLTIVLEWLAGSFRKPLWARLLYLALFLTLFWLARAPEDAARVGRVAHTARWLRVLGAACVALGALGVWLSVCWLLPELVGSARFTPPPELDFEAARLLLPVLPSWPLALGSALCAGRLPDARAYERLGLFVALAFLLHLLAGVHVQALPVVPDLPLSRWLLCFDGALLLLVLALPMPFALRMAAVIVAGLVLRGLGIASWEIDPRVRDMLALIVSAQDRFASGHNPYTLYAMQHGSELPLTYLPGMWLGYGVPRLFGFDLRTMVPLVEALLLALLAWLARRSCPERRRFNEAFVLSFAAVWLFSPSVQWNAIYAEPGLWWAVLGCALSLTFARKFTAAALLLGLAIATRHFAVVIAPFAWLFFIRTLGFRRALPYIALSAGVALSLLTPFVLADPELFWFGTLRWLREYGPAHLDWFFDRFGFMSLFHEYGALSQLPLAQAAVVLACIVGALRARSPQQIAAYAATALLLFIMLNVLLWDSFLLDGAIAACAVIVTRSVPSAPLATAAAEPSARTLRLTYAALTLVLLVGGSLAATLALRIFPAGRDQAHDYVVRAARAGDFVIDRSDRRIAFVEGRWLLRREELPAPIGGELYDGAWHGQSALASEGRVWLISESARDQRLRTDFARLGRELSARSFGSYRVQLLEPLRASPASVRAGAAEPPLVRCPLGLVAPAMRRVSVSAGAPVRLTFARKPRARGALLAAGFPNERVVWPRGAVSVSLVGAGGEAPLMEVSNLRGVQWTTLDPRLASSDPLALTVELTTDDPVPRPVCLELVDLLAR